jgi:hypothetical protein
MREYISFKGKVTVGLIITIFILLSSPTIVSIENASNTLSIIDYKKDTFHKEMITRENKLITLYEEYGTDLVSQLVINKILNLDKELSIIFGDGWEEAYPLMNDLLYLKGNKLDNDFKNNLMNSLSLLISLISDFDTNKIKSKDYSILQNELLMKSIKIENSLNCF